MIHGWVREFLVGIKWKKYEQELEAENLNDLKRSKHPSKKLYCSIIMCHIWSCSKSLSCLPVADLGFFLGGGALVSCSTSTPINQIVFFCRIPVVLENRRSSQGGGGGGGAPPPPPPNKPPPPPPHPLLPPPRSAPAFVLLSITKWIWKLPLDNIKRR